MSDQSTSEGPTGSPGPGDSGTGERQGRSQARRAVILGAAAAGAGAVAGLALPAGAAMASSEAVKPATTPSPPLQITVAVQSSITLSQINALVARITGLIGCTACGMVGVDLRLFGADPADVANIQSLETTPGVAGVVVL